MNKYTGECAADCVCPRKKSFSVTNRFTLIQPCGYASPVVNLENRAGLGGYISLEWSGFIYRQTNKRRRPY